LVRSARDLLHEMWQLWPTLHDGAMDPAPSEYSLMSVGIR
jgi:hypothetical protein